MSLVANFTTAENLSDNSLVTFTDISTGTDNTLTERRIYVRLANGNYLTTSGESSSPAYETWNIADSTKTLALLSSSTTANVTVYWMTNSTITYQVTKLQCWNLYDYVFAFELIQSQTATPNIVQDTNYYSIFFTFITNLWNSETAVTYGDDLYSSQSALNRNQNLIINQNKYF